MSSKLGFPLALHHVVATEKQTDATHQENALLSFTLINPVRFSLLSFTLRNPALSVSHQLRRFSMPEDVGEILNSQSRDQETRRVSD
jgi:hypothetical protein